MIPHADSVTCFKSTRHGKHTGNGSRNGKLTILCACNVNVQIGSRSSCFITASTCWRWIGNEAAQIHVYRKYAAGNGYETRYVTLAKLRELNTDQSRSFKCGNKKKLWRITLCEKKTLKLNITHTPCTKQYYSNNSVGGRPVHGTATYRVWWYKMLYNTIFTSWWWAHSARNM